MRSLQIKISRFKPSIIDPPAFFIYELTPASDWTVLDALEQIRIHQEPSLMYRRACHHASCGTCACTINGVERLACKTKLTDLKTQAITLEPLRCFQRIGDLVTVRNTLFQFMQPDWSCLQPDEKRADHDLLLGGDGRAVTKFENCIECGCCVSACPVARKNRRFLGPAVLSAINQEKIKNPSTENDLLTLAAAPDGEALCQRALACSRVCPTGVYPARHIAELRNQRKRMGKAN
jgi:succinate dehydrogenase / fumarate reductase iron-sulfur subunit